MVEQMQFANGIVSVIGAAAIAGVVLNPRIREGLVCKIGFILMIFGLLGNAAITLTEPGMVSKEAAWLALWNAGFVLRVGIVVVCLGVGWRSWKEHIPDRRQHRSSLY